uniref:Uncharacterized protein n=1 Tax=Siphoviridae sp. cteLh2 TaxID=2825590 RepID=A0A8S5U5V6_9CAUD|nr:MAG TPA: hypothetical protein [Siphoviridae sp. cteLh2]
MYLICRALYTTYCLIIGVAVISYSFFILNLNKLIKPLLLKQLFPISLFYLVI